MGANSAITSFPVQQLVKVPQADEIPRIMKLIELAGRGVRNATSISEKIGFDLRQSSYYREAAEILGFLDPAEAYKPTSLGSLFILSDESTKSKLMIWALLSDPIVGRITSCLQSRLVNRVLREDIEGLIEHISEHKGETIKRRAQTIVAWLRWLQQNFGVISFDGDAVRLETQQKIA